MWGKLLPPEKETEMETDTEKEPKNPCSLEKEIETTRWLSTGNPFQGRDEESPSPIFLA